MLEEELLEEAQLNPLLDTEFIYIVIQHLRLGNSVLGFDADTYEIDFLEWLLVQSVWESEVDLMLISLFANIFNLSKMNGVNYHLLKLNDKVDETLYSAEFIASLMENLNCNRRV